MTEPLFAWSAVQTAAAVRSRAVMAMVLAITAMMMMMTTPRTRNDGTNLVCYLLEITIQ